MKTKLKYSVHFLKQTHSAHVNNMKSESRNSCFPRTFEKPVGFDEIDDNSWTIGLQVTLNVCLYVSEVVFLYNSPFGDRSSATVFSKDARSAGDNSSKPGCRTFPPKAGSPHASSPYFLSAPSSVRPTFSVKSTPFSYVFNVADVTDVRNSKRGYSPCNIGKMRNSHVTAINQSYCL